ncbi:MAG TPA: hypothetical protein VH639_12150 [Bryobacteraceae bacterium]|jgi:hypothetical protein
MNAILLGCAAGLGLGLAAMLILFLSLKRELRGFAREQHRRTAALDEAIKAAATATAPAPPPADPAVVSIARVSSGVNASKRFQAIRLLRRGEDAAHIAAALSVPRREVDLLIRVHRMSAQRARDATAGS